MQGTYTTYDDTTLVKLLRDENQLAFQEIYNRYWKKLFQYIYNQLQVQEQSEEIVQDTFSNLWSYRHNLEITNSLSSYLYGGARKNMLNEIRKEKVRKTYAADFSLFMVHERDNSNFEYQNLQDIHAVIEDCLKRMPDKWQTVFRLSRQEHLSIEKIAERMGTSPKTVTNYLSEALRELRVNLGEFMAVIIILEILSRRN